MFCVQQKAAMNSAGTLIAPATESGGSLAFSAADSCGVTTAPDANKAQMITMYTMATLPIMDTILREVIQDV